ncbi:MAG TPA: mechanosensitive ion channel family protein [Candidatus Baltobacterales bacterium]|nr:mechanosensitive ion channel family protein [Candidatus Baltobacterales bacterium]
MTAPPLGGLIPGIPNSVLVQIVIAIVVFAVFVIGSRLISNYVVARLERRHMRTDMVVIGNRVVTVLLIAIGVIIAVGVAFSSQNFTLAGILMATFVASFGVQDLLKDYVSGYYVLLERHMRVGDRISLDAAGSGTILDVKLRVTLVKTDAGDLLVVPNSELFNKPVTVHVGAVQRLAETKSET